MYLVETFSGSPIFSAYPIAECVCDNVAIL